MPAEPLASFRPEAILTARDITLSYGKQEDSQPILEHINLELKQGEIIALLGPSGAGKSSLLRVLAGLQSPCKGAVAIHGETITGPHPRLGFVFQDPCLLPWLNLEDNVSFGLDFKHQPKQSKAERQARTEAAISDVDLLHARKRYPDELSGGMAQRAALARTLARQPEILLLDEPFSALDEITRRDMQNRLLHLTAKYRTAAVLVTHDIDEALAVADRIVLLGGRPGREVAQWLNPDLPLLTHSGTDNRLVDRPDLKHKRDLLRQTILSRLESISTSRPELAKAA